MKGDFNFFMPLSKVEKTDDGATRTVTGYASTPTKDLDDEIVSVQAIKAALPAYMEWRNIRQMHQPIAVGVAKEATVDQKGLYLTAKIVDANAIHLLDEGVLKGFSIGGRKLAKYGDTITEIELIEISIVDRPANPDCRIDAIKMAKNLTMYGSLDEVAGESEVSWMRKMFERVISGGETPAQIAKRAFTDKEREDAADTGAALPDGSFPIKNEQDLKNAVQAHGRAKDKDKAKAHIIARAKTLGATHLLPGDWEGSTKDDSKDEKAAVLKNLGPSPVKTLQWFESPEPALDGIKAAVVVMKDAPKLCGMTAEQAPMLERLEKGAYTIIDLADAFMRIRSAQRQLVAEGCIEKDGDDHALAMKLGEIASELATVIATKASHEGSEAIYLTDESDIGSYLLSQGVFEMSAQTEDLKKRAAKAARANLAKAAHHLRKAGAAHSAGMACLGKCGQMMGGASKAADGATALSTLGEAHGHFQESADHMEMAHAALGKAASMDGGPNGTVIGDWGSGVEGVGEGERTEGDVPWYSATEPYPGKGARAEGAIMIAGVAYKAAMGADGKPTLVLAVTPAPAAVAPAVPEGFISKREADLQSELAAEKAKNEIYAKLPGGAVFKGRTVIAPPSIGDQSDMALLMDGVQSVNQADQDSVTKAAGTMISNMIANKGRFAKSIFDPSFRGKAGLKN